MNKQPNKDAWLTSWDLLGRFVNVKHWAVMDWVPYEGIWIEGSRLFHFLEYAMEFAATKDDRYEHAWTIVGWAPGCEPVEIGPSTLVPLAKLWRHAKASYHDQKQR